MTTWTLGNKMSTGTYSISTLHKDGRAFANFFDMPVNASREDIERLPEGHQYRRRLAELDALVAHLNRMDAPRVVRQLSSGHAGRHDQNEYLMSDGSQRVMIPSEAAQLGFVPC